MTNYLKKNKIIFFYLLIFFILSTISIYSYTPYLNNGENLVVKQICFYITSFILILLLSKIKIKKLLNISIYLYIINLLLLILVLFVGTKINGTRAWFSIPFIGTIQPSEFMKICLILVEAKITEQSNIKNTKDEINLLLKLLLITIMPSIFTFLEPDTGAVIIFFIIFISILYASNIRNKWFIIMFTIGIIIIGTIFYLYTYQEDLFIKIFNNTLFYRFDRIFNFANSSGMQLENSIIAIASTPLTGNGLKNIPIYYPEGQTDFIFTSLISTYGILIGIFLIVIFILFDIKYIIKAKNEKGVYKYIIFSFITVIIFQQIENISMTIGLLPIIGITLPFISYGGSSLISFSILLGIIMNKEKE